MKSLLLLAALLAVALRPVTVPPEEPPLRQPNLIFLLTDDQRWDALGVAGNALIRTPHLDQLAQEGFYFRRAYVTTPICAISRASLFSGQYARRHGILDFETPFSDSALAQTYPLLLRNAGYRTGFIGKYGVGATPPAQVFDYWRGFPGHGNYAAQDSLGRAIHLTDLMGDQMEDFLKNARPDQPFCLSVSFKAPHAQDAAPVEFPAAERFRDWYTAQTMPKPEATGERYYRQFPDWFRANDRNESRVRWSRRFANDSLFQNTVKSYYRLVSGVDAVVGRLRQTLRERGLSDNTVIVFTSDNGFYLGEYGFSDKWYGHELSLRVPLIVYDPRRPNRQGKQSDRYVLNVDVAPTLLTLAGLPVPKQMQGRSLTTLMDDPRTAWRSAFYFDHRFDLPSVFIPQSEGVLSRERKYVRYFNQRQPGQEYEEVYDLRSDPHELRNLAPTPTGRAMKAGLLPTLQRLRTQAL